MNDIVLGTYDYGYVGNVQDFPILCRLSQERVFYIDATVDVTEFTEGCDEWFSTTLDQKDLRLLADEISRLADMMEFTE